MSRAASPTGDSTLLSGHLFKNPRLPVDRKYQSCRSDELRNMSDTKTGFCLFLINHLLVPRDRQQRLAGEMVPGKGFEPSQRMLADFKSAVSAIPPSGHEYHLK